MTDRVIAAKSPFGVEVKAGQSYFWCRCGRSSKQPLCDGAHKGTGLSPLKYEAREDRTVWFCGCKRTSTEPLCDGSHKKL
jgi:CDGSH-type Zn-finger protein